MLQGLTQNRRNAVLCFAVLMFLNLGHGFCSSSRCFSSENIFFLVKWFRASERKGAPLPYERFFFFFPLVVLFAFRVVNIADRARSLFFSGRSTYHRCRLCRKVAAAHLVGGMDFTQPFRDLDADGAWVTADSTFRRSPVGLQYVWSTSKIDLKRRSAVDPK